MNKLDKEREDIEMLQDDLPASDVPKSVKSLKIWNSVIKYQFIYSILGMGAGLLLMGAGSFLLTQSIEGNSDLSINILNSSFDIKKAAPGAILFLIGLVVIVATRFKINVK